MTAAAETSAETPPGSNRRRQRAAAGVGGAAIAALAIAALTSEGGRAFAVRTLGRSSKSVSADASAAIRRTVTVNAHDRLQAFGPGYSQHRPIRIDTHARQAPRAA